MLVIILTEGAREHINQSRGVANWLSRLTGAEVLEIETPGLSGPRKMSARAQARRLLRDGNRRDALDWLATHADGESLVRAIGVEFASRDIREGDRSVILLSAGSAPALYNIALGYIWRCVCTTIMTPEIIGNEPFDFAIVPAHDYPPYGSNVLITTGAPNLIVREELAAPAALLLRRHPPKRSRRWGILIGGDDKNYRISPRWIKTRFARILREAAREDADLYVATSHRTSCEAEEEASALCEACPAVRFLHLASEDDENPIPAILGACDEIFVTDDSVDMVSEAVTAGQRAVLLRAESPGGAGALLDRAVAAAVRARLLSPRYLRGGARFETTFTSFKQMDALVEFPEWIKERLRGDIIPAPAGGRSFNEAKRAAEWMIGRLNKKAGSSRFPAAGDRQSRLSQKSSAP